MKKKLWLHPIKLAGLLAAWLTMTAALHAQSLSPRVIATAGNDAVISGFRLSSTVGQPVIHTIGGNGYFLTQGFQQPNLSALAISGQIITATGTPVPGVIVSLAGSAFQTFVTSNDGMYSFDVQRGGSCTITPSKSNDIILNNGISTLDIIRIQGHINQVFPLGSPYNIIAADVNGSGSITTLDILEIRKIVLGYANTFPGGRLWTFVLSDYAFPDPLNPFPYDSSRSYTNISSSRTGQDFIGIKLGDVDNSWNAGVAKMGAAEEVQFMMDEHHVLPGDEITVPVKVRDFSGIASYQFTLSWDAGVLSLLEVNNKSLNGYYGEEKISEGLLTTIWTDDSGTSATLDDDAIAFELKFKAIGTSGTYSEIKIGSEITASEAYSDNLDLLRIASTEGMVKVGDVTSIVHHPSSINNLSVYPNPFTSSTTIRFNATGDEAVKIEIYDLAGRQVKNWSGNYEPGEHRIEWRGDNAGNLLLNSGIYHVYMTAGDQKEAVKVVLVR